MKTVLYVGGDFTGEAHATGRNWPFKIRLTSHTPTHGAGGGEIACTSLGSVHRILGKLSGAAITIRGDRSYPRGRRPPAWYRFDDAVF